jgi:hypothetical protein
VFIVVLAGCSLISGIKEDLEGLTSPVVAQGWVLGVEEPDDPLLAPLLESGVVAPGTGVTLFLADATAADQMDESGLAGAAVDLDAGSTSFAVASQGDGLYALEPGPDSPPYDDGAAWVTSIELGDDTTRAVTFRLPPAADLDLDLTHGAGEALALDFADQGFHAALVVVFDVASGDPTYSSEPTSAEDVYELTKNKDPLVAFTVPASAFPEPGTYALGVAGMRRGEDGDLEGVNTLLSRGMAGKMRFFPLLVE